MKRLIFGLVLALAAVFTAASLAATSATISASITITGAGALSITAPASVSGSNTLDGTDQTVTFSPALTVVDARGSGTGWNLTLSTTAVSDGSGHSLNLSVTGVTSSCVVGSTCTNPTNVISYPISLSTTAVKVFNSATNTGMGKFTVTPTISSAVNANSFAGTYSSTVTATSVTGP